MLIAAIDPSLVYPFYLRIVGAAAAAAPDRVETERVEAGWLWRVERIFAVDATSNITGRIRAYLGGGGYDQWLSQITDPSANVPLVDVNGVLLREGQWLGAAFTGATANDVLELHVTGFKVEASAGRIAGMPGRSR